jgi:hypothetical protein
MARAPLDMTATTPHDLVSVEKTLILILPVDLLDLTVHGKSVFFLQEFQPSVETLDDS